MGFPTWRQWLKRIARSLDRSPSTRSRKASPRLSVEALEERLTPATHQWTGLSGDGNWSNTINWLGGAPTGGRDSDGNFADLVFGTQALAVNRTTHNDISSGVFNSITFSAGGYSLDGKALTLGSSSVIVNTGDINVATGARGNFIKLNMTLGNPVSNDQFFTINPGSDLTIGDPADTSHKTGQLSGSTGANLTMASQPAGSHGGTLTLLADNSAFTGAVKLNNNAGILDIQDAHALGTGPNTTVGTGAQLQVGAPVGAVGPGPLAILEPLILNGSGISEDGALLNASDNNVWAGTIQLDSATTLGANANSSLNISGQISDLGPPQDLTKEGFGQIFFSHPGGNTYRGFTTINNGILTIEDPASLGPDALSGGGTAADGTLVNQKGGETGTLQLLDPNFATDGGGFTVRDEVLTLNGTGVAATGVGAGTIGALNNIQGNNTWAGSVTLGSSLPNGSNVFIGVATATAALPSNLTISGVIGDNTGTGGPFTLNKVLGGELILNNANTYTGSTNLISGVLSARDSQALGLVGTPGTVSVSTGASLALEVDTGRDAHNRDLSNDSITGQTGNGPQLGLTFTNSLFISGTGVTTAFPTPTGTILAASGALHSITGINRWTGPVALGSPTAAIGVDLDPHPSSDDTYFTRDYSLTVSGVISGGAGTTFEKVDPGHLLLPTANTYVGPTLINEGWVTIENEQALGGRIAGLGDTVQPTATVASGAALHLKPLVPGTALNVARNLILAGVGITHPFGLISQKGALMNLGGLNTVGTRTITDPSLGSVTISSTIKLGGTVGIGVENPDPLFPQSQLTVTAAIGDGASTGGLTKFGSQGLILQGDGSYRGAVEVQEGTLTAQSDTALGRNTSGALTGTETFTTTNTTVDPGAILQLAGSVANLNGGVAAGIQVSDEHLILTGPGQQVAVNGSTGTFTLTFNSQQTAPLDITDPNLAADMATALNALSSVKNGGTGNAKVTQGTGPTSNIFTVVFGGSLAEANNLLMTATQASSGGNPTIVVSGTNTPLVNVSSDNLWRGPTTLNASSGIDVQPNSRLTLLGVIDDAANITAAGSDLIKQDSGELVLGGSNTYRGVTHIGLSTAFGDAGNVAGGVVTVANDQALGVTTGGTQVANGSTLQLQGNLTVAGEPLKIQGTGVTGAPLNVPYTWFNVGPASSNNGQTPHSEAVSGRVTDVAVDPTDAKVMYIATAGGGAWKTIDGGLTWQQIFDSPAIQTLRLPGTTGTFTLSFNGATTAALDMSSPTLAADIQAALNGLSSIGGLSPLPATVTVSQQNLKVTALSGQSQLFPLGGTITGATAKTDPLVFNITFGGALSATNLPLLTATGIGPTSSPVVTGPTGFTTDSFTGPTATTSAGFSAALYCGAIAVDPNDPRIIYLGTGESNNTADSFYGTGVYRSTDSGLTWTLLTASDGSNPLYGLAISKIVVDPGVPSSPFAPLTADSTTLGTLPVQTPTGRIYVATTDEVSNAPNSAASIATASESGSTVTITTTGAHGFVPGQVVSINGVGVTGYDGIFTIGTVPTATSFTIKNTLTGLGASGGGKAATALPGIYRFDTATRQVQALTVPTLTGAGTFTLSFKNPFTGVTSTTPSLSYSSPTLAKDIQTALDGLASITASSGSVTVTQSGLDPFVFTIAMEGGLIAQPNEFGFPVSGTNYSDRVAYPLDPPLLTATGTPGTLTPVVSAASTWVNLTDAVTSTRHTLIGQQTLVPNTPGPNDDFRIHFPQGLNPPASAYPTPIGSPPGTAAAPGAGHANWTDLTLTYFDTTFPATGTSPTPGSLPGQDYAVPVLYATLGNVGGNGNNAVFRTENPQLAPDSKSPTTWFIGDPGVSEDEIVQVDVNNPAGVSSGSYQLEFPPGSGVLAPPGTIGMPDNASVGVVSANLNAMSTIGGLGGKVVVTFVSASVTDFIYNVEFEGAMAFSQQPLFGSVATAGTTVKVTEVQKGSGADTESAGEFPAGNNGNPTNGNLKVTSFVSLNPNGNRPTFPQVTLYAAQTVPEDPIFFPTTHGQLLGIQTSTDGGKNWKAVPVTPANYMGVNTASTAAMGWYASTILATDATHVIVGGWENDTTTHLGQFLTTPDGGSTWTDFSKDSVGNGPHTGFHAIAANGANVVVGTDGGVWQFNPATNIWTDLNGNLAITSLNSVSTNLNNAANSLGGSQGNGVLLTSGSPAWAGTDPAGSTSGDGGVVHFDPLNPKIAYAVHVLNGNGIPNQPAATPVNGFLDKSIDGGQTWALASPAGPNSLIPDPVGYFPFLVDSVTEGRLLAGGSGPTIQAGRPALSESLDGGVNWASLNVPLFETSALATATYQGLFAADPGFLLVPDKGANTADLQTVYASGLGPNPITGITEPQVWVTKDHGQSWKLRLEGVTVQAMAVDPGNRDTVYVVTSSFGVTKIQMSTDAGLTWNDLTFNLPNLPTWTIAIDPRTDNPTVPGQGTVYIGNDNGVWQLAPPLAAKPSTTVTLADGSALPVTPTWIRFGAGMPSVQVRDIEVNQALNTLTAGTYGRSMYQMYLSAVPPDAQLPLSAVPASGPAKTFTIPSASQQLIAVTGSAGTFTLTFNGSTTGTLSVTSPTLAHDIETALNALPSIQGVGGFVSVSSTTGGDQVTFGGTLAAVGVPLMTWTQAGGATIVVSRVAPVYGALRATSGSSIWTGPVQIVGGGNTAITNVVDIAATGSQLTQNGIGAAQLDIRGVISDLVPGSNPQLNKYGQGNIILSGPNAYAGVTEIKQGVLTVHNATALGGAMSAVQTLSFVGTGTTFSLNFNNSSTPASFIYTGTGGDLAMLTAALNSLSTIPPGALTVTQGTGTASNVFTVTLGGSLSGLPQPAITATRTNGTGAATVAIVSQGGVGTAISEVQTIAFNNAVGTTYSVNFNNAPTPASFTFTGTASDLPNLTAALNSLSTVPANALTVTQGTGAASNVFTVTLGGILSGFVQPAIAVTPTAGIGTAAVTIVALGTGGTIVNPGTALELESDLALERVQLNGDGIPFNGHNQGALRNVSGNNTFTGTLILNTNSTVGVDGATLTSPSTSLTIGSIAGKPTFGIGTVTDGGFTKNLTKELTGTLILASGNTYGGTTVINQGAIQVQDAQALGGTTNGTEVKDGGQLQLQQPVGGPPVVVVGEPLIISGTGNNGTGALLNTGGNNTWQGTISLGDNPVFLLDTGKAATTPPAQVAIGVSSLDDTLTINGVISQEATLTNVANNPLGLSKVGPGRMTLGQLTQTDTYPGVTTVVGGTLRIQTSGTPLGSAANGTVVTNGAVLELDGDPTGVGNAINVTEPLLLNGNGLAGLQAITLTATSGTFKLSFGNSTTGNLNATSSTLVNDIQNALNALASIQGVGGSVTVTQGTGSSSNVFTVAFGGTLAAVAVPLISVTPPTAGLVSSVLTGDQGALRNISGNNTIKSTVTLQTSFVNGSPVGTSIGVDPLLTLTVQGPSGILQDPSTVLVPAGSLTKLGAGTLILPTANTYSGTTFVNNGILNIQNATALGAGTPETQTITITGNNGQFTLTFNGQTTGPLNVPALDPNLAVNMANALNNLSSLKNVNGNVTVTKGTGLNSNVFTVKFGGTLVNTNVPQITFTVLSGGAALTIATTNDGPGGTVVNNGGTLQLQNNITVAKENLTLNGSGFAQAATIAPTGATESSSTVTLTTTTPHGFSVGQTVTVAGVSVTGYNGVFQITGTPTPTTFTYTATQTGLADSGGGTATLPALGALDNVSLSSNTWNQRITLGSNNPSISVDNANDILTLSQSIVDNGNGFGLSKVGPGTLIYSTGSLTPSYPTTSNTYTGTTSVLEGTLRLDKTGTDLLTGLPEIAIAGNLSIGDSPDADTTPDIDTVQLVASNQLATTSTLITLGDGLFDLNGKTQTIATANMTGGIVDLNGGQLTVNGNITGTSDSKGNPALIQDSQPNAGGSVTLANAAPLITVNHSGTAAVDMTISALLAGTHGLTKTGDGVLRLTNNETYTGTTAINNGILQVDGSLGPVSGPFNPVSLTGGTLAGTGTVGTVTSGVPVAPSNVSTMSSGDSSPGFISPGILTVGSPTANANVTWNPQTNFFTEIDGDTPGTGPGFSDQLFVNGTVNLGGARLTGVVDLDYTAVVGHSWIILESTGNISGAFAQGGNGATVFLGAAKFQVTINNNPSIKTVTLTRLATSTTLTVAVAPTSGVPNTVYNVTATIHPETGANGLTPGTVNLTVAGPPAFGTQNFSVPVTFSAATGDTGVLPLQGIPVGTYQVTFAQFVSSDPGISGSTAQFPPTPTFTVAKDNTSVATPTASPPTPSVFGQTVTFSTTVTSVTPGGPVGNLLPTGNSSSVTWFDGGVALTGSAYTITFNPATGVSTLTTAALAASGAPHTITASYAGDSNYNASPTSGTLSYTVNKATPTLVVSSTNATNAPYGSPTITVAVNPPFAGSPAATGNVTFFVTGTQSFSEADTLNSSGVGTLQAVLTPGTYSITASYGGDNNFNIVTTSNTLNQTVVQASTGVTVHSDHNPSVLGQPVVFSATISAVPPGGSATGSAAVGGKADLYIDNLATPVQTDATVSNGSVTFSAVSNLTVSASGHVVEIVYKGDSNYTANSNTLAGNQVVNKGTPAVAVSSNHNPSVVGQAVTFSAVITPQFSGTPAASGTADLFLDGSATATQTGATVTSGQVSFSPITFSSATPAGSPHTVQIVYNGDANYTSSSGTLQGGQTVNKAGTITTVVSSSPFSGGVYTSTYGDQVTFTATVTAVPAGSVAPTGHVNFFDVYNNTSTQLNATPVALSTVGGQQQASYTTSSLQLQGGSHSITAVYLGDDPSNPNFTTSTSDPISQVVNKAASAVTTPITDNATPHYGQTFHLSATVSAGPGLGTPTGTVNFLSGSTVIGSGTIGAGGVATATITNLGVGDYDVTAQYQGDPNFAVSNSPGSVHEKVLPDSTNTAVSSTNSNAVYGEAVIKATVTNTTVGTTGTPTGSVTFTVTGSASFTEQDNLNSSGVATLQQVLTPGTYTISAAYPGDTNFSSSSGALAGNQVVSQASTNVTVASNHNPSVYGQAVTFSATISAVAPGGTVANSQVPNGTADLVIDGSTVQSGATVTNGSVTFAAISNLDVAHSPHAVTVSYNGNSNYKSGSGLLANGQAVSQASATVTNVTSSANPSVLGQPVTFSATITPQFSGVTAPGGTANLVIDGSTVQPNVAVSSGSVTFAPISNLTPNGSPHSVVVTYNGDVNYQSGSSGTLPGGQTVTKAGSTTALSGPVAVVTGDTATYTATVTAVSPATGTPTGTVTFIVDGSAQAPIGLTNGVANFNTVLSPGVHSIGAQYNGDTTFSSSQATVVNGVTGNPGSTIQVTVTDRNTAFVLSVYHDVLGRPVPSNSQQLNATINEIQGWLRYLNSGGSRSSLVQMVEQGPPGHPELGIEYQVHTVLGLYHQYLHRDADFPGLVGFVQLMQHGGTQEQVAALMVASQEYYINFGGNTNDGWVTAIFSDILHSTAGSDSRQAIDQALSLQLSRTQIASILFVNSSYLAPLVTGYYNQFLHRNPDAAGLNGFVGAMQAGLTDETVIALLVGSDEYYNNL